MSSSFIGRRHFIALGAAAALTGLWSPPARAAAATILIVGDSLSAEYGIERGSGWVALLERRLARERIDARIVNASVSGETTSGGRSRLPALLKKHRPTHVLIELGGNDALRGLPIAQTQANLDAMTQAAQQAGAKVVLIGMQLPPNYGGSYARSFEAIYRAVADDRRVPLVPFLLKNVADVPNAVDFFQPDRIHPRAEAQPLMLDNVWPILKPLLR
ncbi:arylesterase [Caldimonas tepidiphila]|uniref:arylesterase n=1 Tax=Caldimonas tepidiphila TaxID=2315841 RepID=UPI000E5B9686|nr:arylesterase [Caldimonas tepidiphila]